MMQVRYGPDYKSVPDSEAEAEAIRISHAQGGATSNVIVIHMLRALVAEGKIPRFEIVFPGNCCTLCGEDYGRKAEVLNDGSVPEWPDGVADELGNALTRILKASREARV